METVYWPTLDKELLVTPKTVKLNVSETLPVPSGLLTVAETSAGSRTETTDWTADVHAVSVVSSPLTEEVVTEVVLSLPTNFARSCKTTCLTITSMM